MTQSGGDGPSPSRSGSGIVWSGTTTIRQATREDAAAMLEIYRPFVVDSTVSFELEPPTREEFAGRIEAANASHSWLAAVAENPESGGETVLGYAYGGRFSVRAAYRYSAETSIYMHDAARGTGLARKLYEALFEALRQRDIFNVYAGATLPNPASAAFHKACGFEPVGVYRRAGFKFGAWHDVAWWQRSIQEGQPAA